MSHLHAHQQGTANCNQIGPVRVDCFCFARKHQRHGYSHQQKERNQFVHRVWFSSTNLADCVAGKKQMWRMTVFTWRTLAVLSTLSKLSWESSHDACFPFGKEAEFGKGLKTEKFPVNSFAGRQSIPCKKLFTMPQRDKPVRIICLYWIGYIQLRHPIATPRSELPVKTAPAGRFSMVQHCCQTRPFLSWLAAEDKEKFSTEWLAGSPVSGHIWQLSVIHPRCPVLFVKKLYLSYLCFYEDFHSKYTEKLRHNPDSC